MAGRHAWRVLAMAAAVVLVGCGGAGPIDSGTISLTVNSINSSDIRTAGTVQKDENIGTQTGNPWGRFIDEAQEVCGADPVGFEVTSVSIAIDPGSDVPVFEDVISGTATVTFADNSGNDATALTVDVASVSAPTGAGPIQLTVNATRQTLQSLLRRLVGGDFHVGFRGQTSLTGNDTFSMDVRISVDTRAFCD